VKFFIDVVHTKAEGSESELAKLGSQLSFAVPGAEWTTAYRKGGWNGMKSLLKGGDKFPSGLAFEDRFADVTKEMCYSPVKVQGFSVADLRVYQERAAKAFMSGHRGVICMPPGTGKTIVGIDIAGRVGYPTIWLTHRIELAQQVAKHCKQYGFNPSLWGGGVHEKATDFVVATLQTLHARGFPPDSPDFQTVVFDECHHVANDNTYYDVMSKIEAPWRLGLTATPPHESLPDAYLRGSTGKVYTVDPKYLQDKGFLCIPDLVTLRGVEYPETLRYQELLTMISNDKRRAMSLWYQLSNWDQVIVFVTRIKHGQLLEMIARKLGLHAEFVSGRTSKLKRADALERFAIGQLPYLITNLWDEGVDLPELETVCLAEPFISERLVVQRCGRVMRPGPEKRPEVLDVLDVSSRCLEMFRKRLRTYRDLGIYAP